MFEVQKDVPIPKGVGRKPKYPLGTMNVGESFFVPDVTVYKLSCTAAYYKPKKFACRTKTENGTKGVRVWRLE